MFWQVVLSRKHVSVRTPHTTPPAMSWPPCTVLPRVLASAAVLQACGSGSNVHGQPWTAVWCDRLPSPNVLPCANFVTCPCCSWVGLDLQTWQLLAIHCSNLKQLTIGFEGGEESVYDSASFYSSQLTDLSLQIVAQCCPKLRCAAQQLRARLSRKDVHCCIELHQRGAV